MSTRIIKRFCIYKPFAYESWQRLIDFFSCVEEVENKFDMEFSCGDGLFFSDTDDLEYDGKVDYAHAPRCRTTQKLLDCKSHLVFEICGSKIDEQDENWNAFTYKIKQH